MQVTDLKHHKLGTNSAVSTPTLAHSLPAFPILSFPVDVLAKMAAQ